MPFWPEGLQESLGDSLVTTPYLNVFQNVYYVLYSSGDDTNNGLDRVKPFKTLKHAVTVTNAAGGSSLIMLMDGHAETLVSGMSVTQNNTCIVGAGMSGGLPTVKLTPSGIAAPMINVMALSCLIANVGFYGNVADSAYPKVSFATASAGSASTIRGCYFECGTHDTNAVEINSNDSIRIESTTFLAAGTQGSGIYIPSPGNVRFMVMEDVIFDGGSTGFWKQVAFSAADANALTAFRFERISLLRGSDMDLGNEISSGILQVSSTSGGARIDYVPGVS